MAHPRNVDRASVALSVAEGEMTEPNSATSRSLIFMDESPVHSSLATRLRSRITHVVCSYAASAAPVHGWPLPCTGTGELCGRMNESM